jgi:catalase (peroxidase I)
MASHGLDQINLRIAPVRSSECLWNLSTVIRSSPQTHFLRMSIKGKLMMLPVDIALVAEPAFRKWVEVYAKDEDKFFKVSAALAYCHSHIFLSFLIVLMS